VAETRREPRIMAIMIVRFGDSSIAISEGADAHRMGFVEVWMAGEKRGAEPCGG
jgi:hypothetical protein